MDRRKKRQEYGNETRDDTLNACTAYNYHILIGIKNWKYMYLCSQYWKTVFC